MVRFHPRMALLHCSQIHFPLSIVVEPPSAGLLICSAIPLLNGVSSWHLEHIPFDC